VEIEPQVARSAARWRVVVLCVGLGWEHAAARRLAVVGQVLTG